MINKPQIRRRTVQVNKSGNEVKPRRPGAGPPTLEQRARKQKLLETKELLEKKTKMMRTLFDKAQQLIDEGETNEGRQCLSMVKELECDVEQLEKKIIELKNEPKKQKQEVVEEEEQTFDEWKQTTIFRPMEVDDETGEYRFIEWDEVDK